MGKDEGTTIAILGYSDYFFQENAELAYNAGGLIAKRGIAICTGFVGGISEYAFRGAKSVGGKTIAVLSVDPPPESKDYCDEVLKVFDSAIKHKTMARISTGAIVIGGGERTKLVVERFLKVSKPVVAITNTGGIVDYLGSRVVKEENIENALKIIL